MKSAAVASLLIGLAAAACRSEPPAEPQKAVRRPPAPACDQARAELNREGRGGDFLFEESGTAMVGREGWLRMDEADRDRLIEALAVLAGCSAATPQREVEVTIRAETGVVLSTRRVEPSTDFRAGAN